MSFPRLQVPRPPQNTPPAANVRPPEKPLGYVKPAAAADSLRSTSAAPQVTSHIFVRAPKAPEPPVDMSKPLTPADVPWTW